VGAITVLKIGLFEAAAILALVDPFLRRVRSARSALNLAYGALAALSMLAFLNFGDLHGRGQLPHWAEQFHFDLGDKYLRELRYDGLYPATSAAMAERGIFRRSRQVRDTMTFEMIPASDLAEREKEVRARFTEARWKAFGDDLASILAEERGAASVEDHGNTSSPSGALGPWLLMKVIPLRAAGFRVLGSADLALLLLAFLACWRFASLRVAAFTITFALLPPNVTDFLLGSLFRFDWLAAALLGTLAAHRRRWGLAGAFFAYAALARPFAAGFGVCAGVGLAGEAWRRTVDWRALVRFLLSALGTAAVLVLVSSLLFGWQIWPDYAVRTSATVREGYYGINHGLRDVWVQLVHDGARGLVRPIPPSIFAESPGALEPAHGLGIMRFALAVLVLVAAFRDGAVMGAGFGVPLVFTSVVTNTYYQSMWAVLALACALHAPASKRARVGLALAGAMFAFRWVVLGAPELGRTPHYFASWTTLVFTLVWVGVGLEMRRLRPTSPRTP
jgi:hypothetical protein